MIRESLTHVLCRNFECCCCWHARGKDDETLAVFSFKLIIYFWLWTAPCIIFAQGMDIKISASHNLLSSKGLVNAIHKVPHGVTHHSVAWLACVYVVIYWATSDSQPVQSHLLLHGWCHGFSLLIYGGRHSVTVLSALKYSLTLVHVIKSSENPWYAVSSQAVSYGLHHLVHLGYSSQATLIVAQKRILQETQQKLLSGKQIKSRRSQLVCTLNRF